MQRAQTAEQIHRFRNTSKSRPITQQLKTRDRFFQKSITDKEFLDVQPPEVIFHDIEANKPLETWITVRNLTQIPRRIRISQPRTAKFRVDYDMSGALAAGLCMKLVVYFESNTQEDFHDDFTITSQDGIHKIIELKALKPQAFLEFPKFLDIGYAQVGTPKIVTFNIINKGKQGGKVVLNSDKLRLDPKEFTVQPNQTTTVTVEYFTHSAAVFRHQIQVVQPLKQSVDSIEVSCIAVDYAIFFIGLQKEQTTAVDFQEVLLGYSKPYHGQLVNNTPIRQSWKVITKKGFHTSATSGGQLQTPNQVGMEWLEKVIRIYPEKGELEPYAQVPIKIECKAPVNEEAILKVCNFAFMVSTKEKPLKEIQPNDFNYSLFFAFQNKYEDALMLQIAGKHVIPQVQINKQSLSFGDCLVNDSRDASIFIENTHKGHSIDISFSKAPQFQVSPHKAVLAPLSKMQFIVTFAPKNVGRVTSSFDVLLVDGQYPIKVHLQGHAIFNPDKRPVTRGPEALPQDFLWDKKYVDDKQIEYLQKRRHEIKSENLPKRKNYVEALLDDESEQSLAVQQQRMQQMSEYEQERYSEKLQQYYQTRQNQETYNNYLSSQRTSRVQKQKEQILKTRMDFMQEQIKNQNLNDDKPVDLEFQLGLMDNSISQETDLQLPDACDGLYVTKPIDKYEPVTNQRKIFQPDPLQPVKKYFASEPSTHKERREINMDLTGEELKRIQAGPVQIDFGNVFIKSEISRTFHIKNDLRTAISCQILIEADEMKGTYQNMQIIPSSDTGKFEIKLKSGKLGEFKRNVQYVINGKHRFEFAISAMIEAVRIELSQKEFKFQFKDDNTQLETSELIRLTNPGNARAYYKWVLSEQNVFYVSNQQSQQQFDKQQLEGYIESQKTIDVYIVYRPSNCIIKDEKPSPGTGKSNLTTNINNQIRVDEDKLMLQITDGKEQVVKVSGQVNDAKCILKSNMVDMKELLVCKDEEKHFSIRNTSRVTAIFRILDDQLPVACTVTPISDKILADESKDILVKYNSKEQSEVKTDIQIVLRNGRLLKIPFYVKTVIPQVVILQEQFDFGKLTTLGNEGSLKMTLINMSSIAAELTLNLDKDSLEAPDGIECLKIQPVDDLDKSVLKSIHEEKDENQEQSDSDNMNSDAGSEHSEEDLEQIKSKKYSLTIQGNSKLEFYLKFSPRDVKTYTFELPILLNRYGRLPGLTKQVICRGLKPRFVMDPQQIEFPRKIITSMEKLFPTTVEITLSNPERKTVQWRMDINNLLPERIFNIYPTEGKIDSGQTVKLKAQFNPNKADFFHKSVPVFIDSQENSYLELILKGTAAQPKIQFDRREVLLPCVPLNVEASCTFRILNDGYENLNLRHKVYGEEGNINIHLRFPEGNNIGMSKKRLRVDALFQSSKPLSFTTRIEFYDEVGKVYTIPVSGTADNCLLSNYSYLQRQQGYFRIEEKQPQGPLMLVEDDQDNGNDDNLRKAQSMVSYRTFSSLSGRSVTSALGYSPIPQDLVEQNKQYATKCLKFFLWSTNIHSFPDGIIEQDGLPIFELISLFSNRPMPLPCQQFLEKGSKKLERVAQLLKMYDELIRMLKSEGALLNHIRPYHLLSFNDLNASFKLMTPEESDLIHPNVLKITQQRYNYISIDSWCSVFHQVLKIYMLSRLNHKFFRTIPGIPSDKNTLNDQYVVGSNLYSPQEGMLLRWLEVFLETYNSQQNLPPPQRIKNLSQLKDGLHLAAVLYYYVGNSVQKIIKDLKQECLTELDHKFNIQKILQVFSEIRFSIPLDLSGLIQPSGREMIIFIMHLFNQIPHYLPKGTETFSCVLGQQVVRTILLSNRTNKPISYWVKLEKDEDFKSESGDAIRLEPGVLNFPFKIKFTSRVSQPVYDRITFMSKRDNNAFTGAIVYDLKSQITGRESKSVELVTTQLYEQKDFSISVQTDFFKSDFGNFTIKLIHERIVEQPKKKNKLYQEKDKQPDVFPAIFCRLDSIRLKRNSPYQLSLQYIPLVMESQRCYIVFTDPLVGEFQYEIIATPEPPDIYGDPKVYQVYVDQQQIIDLQVAPRNELLQRARKNIEQLLAEGKNPKKIATFPGGEPEITLFDVELTQHFGYLSIPKQLTIHDLQRQKLNRQLREKQEKLEKEKIQQEAAGQEKQNQITQASQNKKLDNSQVFSMNQSFLGADMVNTSNKLPITFMFKNPIKDMAVTITLKSQDKTDVRRIKLLITSLPKPTKASMEIKCPAREVVVQDIPLVNNSDKDWTIKFVLTQDGGPNNQLFQLTNIPLVTSKDQHEHGNESKFVMGGYKDQIVKKKQRLDVKLQFNPKWICHTEGHLTITNTTTSDIYDYTLSGTGEEPLASSNIVMKCQARQQNKTEIVLYNHSNNILKYRVETDLINASGLTQFTIQPLKKYRYELIVMPMLSGQYNGQITFYEESGEYVWYTVVLDTDSPQAEKEIDIITQARKPVAFDIEISNPMPDEQATFEVSVQGEHLLGAKYFTVLPQSSSIYELIYLPHVPEKKKAQIGFIHYKLGEIWYNLNLISEDKQAHRTPVLRAELGKVEQHEVLLDNPTGKEIEVETIISNMANFDVLPANIVLAPYEQTRVFIRYIPSSLDQVQQGDITFKTKEIGKWDYIVYGLGIPPTVFSETTVTIGINKDYSDVINFKNPFKETIQVTISLESEDQACLEAFQLLLKKKTESKTTIQGLQSLQIPFSFTPRQIRSYRCELVIAMNEKIKWRYPLVGHTESFATGRFTQFKTKCRIQFIQDFRFQLPGAGQSSNFTFELKNIQENHKLLIDKFFKLKMIANQIQQDDELVFEALFNPLKPFKTNFDLIIKRESGGVWKFPLFLEATQPDIDDIIVISSPLGKQSSVAFRLTNRNKSLAAFNAYFLPTSDQEFTVSPKQGLLEPNGREGNLFVIKFTPLEYGQIRQGILVIETDDMYWSYKVKGTLPKYDPPVGQTKIDTHINVGQTFKPRNILQANIKKSVSPNQKSTATISNLNFSRKSMATTTFKDTKSLQFMKTQKQEQSTFKD